MTNDLPLIGLDFPCLIFRITVSGTLMEKVVFEVILGEKRVKLCEPAIINPNSKLLLFPYCRSTEDSSVVEYKSHTSSTVDASKSSFRLISLAIFKVGSLFPFRYPLMPEVLTSKNSDSAF